MLLLVWKAVVLARSEAMGDNGPLMVSEFLVFNFVPIGIWMI